MGARGPARTPTALLRLRGSDHANRRGDEPIPVPGAPECPDWLKGESRDEWFRQIADLNERGLLAQSYRPSLAMFCAAWGEMVEAIQMIEEVGSTVATSTGYQAPSPWIAIRNKARDAAVKLGREFGFSPSAASGLSVVPNRIKPVASRARKWLSQPDGSLAPTPDDNERFAAFLDGETIDQDQQQADE